MVGPVGRRLSNPFRPGAGHKPPYLAGRDAEKQEFQQLLEQEVILQNLVLTGLRGVGKTVLLDEFRDQAVATGWLWVGTDLNEEASVSEKAFATRLLTDLSAATTSIVIGEQIVHGFGFSPEQRVQPTRLDYETLWVIYNQAPGLMIDRLKAVLEVVGQCLPRDNPGLVFAYDEAQNLSDHPHQNQHPLSLLLDLFQSLQRKNYPMMLVLAGLPMLAQKLVTARTYSERMFHVMFLGRLNPEASREAILKPIAVTDDAPGLHPTLVDTIIAESGGYPYFIQFICREVYDIAIRKSELYEPMQISVPEISRKLDNDFFAARWSRATERQRELLQLIASLEDSDNVFTIQQIVEQSERQSQQKFGASQISQMLNTLMDHGLIYRDRRGMYAFAVPLLGRFLRRQQQRLGA